MTYLKRVSHLDRNRSSPTTNILAGIELLKEKLKLSDETDLKIINLLEEEISKIKNYVNKTLSFHIDHNTKVEKINIHECLIYY